MEQITAMKKALKLSINAKTKANWSKDVGAGFLKEEILRMGCDYVPETKTFLLNVMFQEDINNYIIQPLSEFNLNETKELLKWLEENVLIFNPNFEAYQKVRK